MNVISWLFNFTSNHWHRLINVIKMDIYHRNSFESIGFIPKYCQHENKKNHSEKNHLNFWKYKCRTINWIKFKLTLLTHPSAMLNIGFLQYIQLIKFYSCNKLFFFFDECPVFGSFWCIFRSYYFNFVGVILKERWKMGVHACVPLETNDVWFRVLLFSRVDFRCVLTKVNRIQSTYNN